MFDPAPLSEDFGRKPLARHHEWHSDRDADGGPGLAGQDDDRLAASLAGKIAANGRLDSAFGRLLALTENYPQLRSSDQFMRLQDELAGSENRIAVARKRYNDALQDYNTFVLQFPNSIWAGMAGFHQNPAYFTASPAAQQTPQVHF